MRVSLATAGTRGDVEPFVALALALQERGCEVTLAAPAGSRDVVERVGVPFAPVRADYMTVAKSDAGMRAIGGDPRATWRRMLQDFRSTAEGGADQAADLITASA